MGHSMRIRGWRLSLSPQEAAIDRNQSQRDQTHAPERVAGEDLAEKSNARKPALTGINNVTKRRLVAPALFKIRKQRR